MRCGKHTCAQCNDKLIHLTNRGPDESSSPLGQHVHDNLPNTFYWMDSDAVVYKLRTRIWRQVEHKFHGQELSASQNSMLPYHSMMVQSQVDAGAFAEDSGVFVLWTDPQFTHGEIARVLPQPTIALGSAVYLDQDRLNRFLSGEHTGGIPLRGAA
jgi:hypothetical protein